MDESLDNFDSQNSDLNNISIYPNPTTGVIHLRAENIENGVQLMVFDTTGSILIREDFSANRNSIFSEQIHLKNFTTGMYYIQMINNDQNVVKKIYVI
jgi:hypothetical protein